MPEYIDHAHGYGLTRPRDDELIGEGNCGHSPNDRSTYPFHPSFGEESAVAVKVPPKLGDSAGPVSNVEAVKTSEAPCDSNGDQGQEALGGLVTGRDPAHRLERSRLPLHQMNVIGWEKRLSKGYRTKVPWGAQPSAISHL